MVTLHYTVRGEIGGRRAEVRLEPGAIRVQVLTIVTQQPTLDVTFSIRDLTELRLLRKIQWSYVVVAVIFAVLIGSNATPSMRQMGWTGLAALVLFLPVTFGLIAWLLPRNAFRIASQDSHIEVEVSLFTRRRVKELVNAVRELRPDLEA